MTALRRKAEATTALNKELMLHFDETFRVSEISHSPRIVRQKMTVPSCWFGRFILSTGNGGLSAITEDSETPLLVLFYSFHVHKAINATCDEYPMLCSHTTRELTFKEWKPEVRKVKTSQTRNMSYAYGEKDANAPRHHWKSNMSTSCFNTTSLGPKSSHIDIKYVLTHCFIKVFLTGFCNARFQDTAALIKAITSRHSE
ncbi:hypothetical protein ROZALSC1DRAFT_23928 [Rozella allomycis CSF55]|uniref:Uncharacterized protein n=1 Tax=Rozella allomycis (strain CSF55) TaxID=988480 RepID=A0A4P9YET3_ROZAC|nr:hypothetical protein ROZALSC1DRAFT_23928 [Rozella allomycis CSF55]